MTRFLTIRQTLILSAVGIKRYLSKQLKISLPCDTNKALSCLEGRSLGRRSPVKVNCLRFGLINIGALIILLFTLKLRARYFEANKYEVNCEIQPNSSGLLDTS